MSVCILYPTMPLGLHHVVAGKRPARLSRPAMSQSQQRPLATHPLEASCDIRPVRELLGHRDASRTMIRTHLMNRGTLGVKSPIDRLRSVCAPVSRVTAGAPIVRLGWKRRINAQLTGIYLHRPSPVTRRFRRATGEIHSLAEGSAMLFARNQVATPARLLLESRSILRDTILNNGTRRPWLRATGRATTS